MLGYARIISPANGVVVGAARRTGGTLVQPGTVILKVAEIDRVRSAGPRVAVADLAGIRPRHSDGTSFPQGLGSAHRGQSHLRLSRRQRPDPDGSRGAI